MVWAVPSHCRLGGVTAMHYFCQMTWPVGFFIFFQLPNHLHDSLMGSFYQLICLGVIGVVCSFFMLRSLHILPIMLLIKFTAWLLRSMARAPKIKSMWRRSIGAIVCVQVLWTNCLHATSNVCRTLGTSAPDRSFLSTRRILWTRTVCGHAFDGLCLSGTQSVWWHGAPWEL